MHKDGDELILKGDAARAAARRLSTTPTSVKNQAIANIANSLKSRQEELARLSNAIHARMAQFYQSRTF